MQRRFGLRLELTMSNYLNERRGWTLVELMAAIAIMGILIAIVAPKVNHVIGRAKQKVRIRNKEIVKTAIRAVYMDTGRWPDTKVAGWCPIAPIGQALGDGGYPVTPSVMNQIFPYLPNPPKTNVPDSVRLTWFTYTSVGLPTRHMKCLAWPMERGSPASDCPAGPNNTYFPPGGPDLDGWPGCLECFAN